MRVKLLTLRFAPSLGGFDDRPLADFVRNKEVLAVREHFFTVHDLPHLACLVTYQETMATPAEAAPTGKQSRSEQWREQLAALSAEDQLLLGNLREWRADRARKDGVPSYVILTNRELFAVVRTRPATPNALLALEGIGPGKVE